MKERIRVASQRWLSLCLTVLQLWFLAAFVVACGSGGSGSPLAVAPPQGVQGIASPVAVGGSSPVPVALSSPALPIADPSTTGIVPALPAADPSEGTLSDDELQQMLFGSEGAGLSLAVNPVGRFLILNQSLIDGQALVFGQSLPLQVQALDSQGLDISSEVEWVDISNRRWGMGKSVAYVAGSESRMETIQARLRGKIERVSFTVSPPDVIVAKSVKVFPDSSAYRISKVEVEQGSIELTPDKTMPTIRVGDVVIGAKGSVPPAKVTGAQVMGGGKVRLQVRAALPKELIEKGTATFEQQVDWSGSTPAGGIEIVNIQPTPFHIADILSPKWSGFVRAGDPVQKGLRVTAEAKLNWKPTYKGSVVFDKTVGDGIRTFKVDQSGKFQAEMNLKMDGTDGWFESSRIYTLLKAKKTNLSISVGPVTFFTELSLTTDLYVIPSLSVNQQANYELKLQDGNFSETNSYNASSSSWVSQGQINNVNLMAAIKDNSDLLGTLKIDIYPQTQIKFWTLLQPKTGLEIEGLAAGILDQAKVEDLSSQSSSIFKQKIDASYILISSGGMKYLSGISNLIERTSLAGDNPLEWIDNSIAVLTAIVAALDYAIRNPPYPVNLREQRRAAQEAIRALQEILRRSLDPNPRPSLIPGGNCPAFPNGVPTIAPFPLPQRTINNPLPITPVTSLEVGSYGEMSRRSNGDGLTPDHQPSIASIIRNREQQLGQALTPAEREDLRNRTNTIVIPTSVHRESSRTFAGRNNQSQINSDANDLESAARRDQQALRQPLIDADFSPEAIDQAFKKLNDLNKKDGYY